MQKWQHKTLLFQLQSSWNVIRVRFQCEKHEVRAALKPANLPVPEENAPHPSSTTTDQQQATHTPCQQKALRSWTCRHKKAPCISLAVQHLGTKVGAISIRAEPCFAVGIFVIQQESREAESKAFSRASSEKAGCRTIYNAEHSPLGLILLAAPQTGNTSAQGACERPLYTGVCLKAGGVVWFGGFLCRKGKLFFVSVGCIHAIGMQRALYVHPDFLTSIYESKDSVP